MNRFLLAMILIIVTSGTAMAQRQHRLSKEDRDKYLTEMRQLKHDFIANDLSLTKEQQNEFFPIYDQMEDEINALADETRQLEGKVTQDAKASNTEIESAARAVFEQKEKEGAIEMKYFVKYKEILNPRQLLGLKNAERKFTQHLLKQHRQRSNAK